MAVSDEVPDHMPGTDPPEGSVTLAQYDGKNVVQRFAQDGRTYDALDAHLEPGTAPASFAVGQTVRAGDVDGELGHSGTTDPPHLHLHLHLHLHVTDGPDPLAGDGLTYQFDSLPLAGRGDGAPPSTRCSPGNHWSRRRTDRTAPAPIGSRWTSTWWT